LALVAAFVVPAAKAATPPAFMVQPVTQFLLVGGTASFDVMAAGSGPISYQWQSGVLVWDTVAQAMVVNSWTDLLDDSFYAGSTTPTLTVTGATFAMGNLQFRCVATNTAGTTLSSGASLSLQYTVYVGAYFGSLANGGNWALFMRSLTAGDFLAYLPGRHSAIVQPVTVDPVTGAFSATGTELVASGPAAAFTLSGTIQAPGSGMGPRTVVGQLAGLGETFAGVFRAGNGSLTPSSGSFYTATALNGDRGTVYAVVGYGGDVLAVAVSPTLIDSTSGVLEPNGSLSTTTVGGGQFTLTIDSTNHLMNVSLTPAASPKATRYAGLAAQVVSTTRLVNLSMRAAAGTGDQTLIMGYVLQGTGTRTIFLRGVGPTLSQYAVANVLADPRLQVFNEQGRQIAENDNWSFSAEGTSLLASLGAFSLPSGSKDAAVLMLSGPGVFSGQVTSTDATTGVVLCEAYDGGQVRSGEASDPGDMHLANLSARGPVGIGGGILIGGFVLSGNGPKRLLIRGIGPTLSNYGVSGVLADPRLELYQGDTKITENDNWSAGTELKSAFTQTGAFPLADASKDAALLVTLQPGVYSAHLSGVNNATGIALLEIYELP